MTTTHEMDRWSWRKPAHNSGYLLLTDRWLVVSEQLVATPGQKRGIQGGTAGTSCQQSTSARPGASITTRLGYWYYCNVTVGEEQPNIKQNVFMLKHAINFVKFAMLNLICVLLGFLKPGMYVCGAEYFICLKILCCTLRSAFKK